MSWSCAACTFVNEDSAHLACTICGTARQPVEGAAVSALNDARLQAALNDSNQSAQRAGAGPAAPSGQSSVLFGQRSSAPFGQRSAPLGQTSVPFGQAAVPAAPTASASTSAAPAPTATVAAPRIDLSTLSEAEQMAQVMKMSRATELEAWQQRNVRVKVSSEPGEGESGSCVIFIVLGDHQLQRRFWCDCTLQQVYNFVMTHEAVFDKFGTSEVQLTDYNQHPPAVLGADLAERERTLAGCDCGCP